MILIKDLESGLMIPVTTLAPYGQDFSTKCTIAPGRRSSLKNNDFNVKLSFLKSTYTLRFDSSRIGLKLEPDFYGNNAVVIEVERYTQAIS